MREAMNAHIDIVLGLRSRGAQLLIPTRLNSLVFNHRNKFIIYSTFNSPSNVNYLISTK
jgi:hypothetical protein